MVLITVLATGLLGLASIELRKSSSSDARAAAQANARLGLMLALGQLQKTLGDDRRVTADGAIQSANAAQPNLVGAWQSWSPNLVSNPLQAVGSDFYDKEKNSRFKGWLLADTDPQRVLDRKFAEQSPAGNGVQIFKTDTDGFVIEASRIPVNEGVYSWAVSQEATKAKINVGGPEKSDRNPNDDLIAQARPNLSLSDNFKQPDGDWDFRSARILSSSQSELDNTLANNVNPTAWRDFTTQSMGLITDVVKGGLKVDLNLGFDLSDSDFGRDSLATGFPNPFRSGASDFSSAVPSSYKGQRPLFRPNTANATHMARMDTFAAAQVMFDFPGAGVPTFDTLRKFYRIPYHLYTTAEGVTAFERPGDHVAFVRTGSVPSGMFRTPWNTPTAAVTQSSIRPVVDRVIFLLSASVSTKNEPSLVVTPVITLWNPYNVALEIEGAVAYPWIDVPFNVEFTTAAGKKYGGAMSRLLGRQLVSLDHGRSVDPYFYAAINSAGSQQANPTPIRFQPGEVRVFTSSSPARKTFAPATYGSPSSIVNIAGIMTWLKPVNSISDYSTKGGLEIPLTTETMASTDSGEITFTPANAEDYPFFISVEDATRTKAGTPTTGTRGQSLVDVLQRNFGKSGEWGSSTMASGAGFKSVRSSFASLKAEPVPFAAIEFYHRYAKTGADQSADLLYTGNPRQPWMSQYMTNATVPSGPQYKLRVRGPITTFNNVMEVETGSGARRAFYGAGNTSATGQSKLPFFELPRAPMLSLAAFQHADLSPTPFVPANQFGNSWASAYVPRNRTMVAQTGSSDNARPPIYDTVYLTNEALWDGFFFSGIAPDIEPSGGSGSANVWSTPKAPKRRVSDVLDEFVKDPAANPLRNSRMRFVKGDLSEEDVVKELEAPEGCMKAAAHLMVDGAFNINSTNVEAWTAFLSGLRGASFTVDGGSGPNASSIPFPRFQYPSGKENDNWNGFRSLNDSQLRTLAQNIVREVQTRGPFLSLGEFVNRRVSSDTSGLKGALQAAIDNGNVNGAAQYDTISPAALSLYPASSRNNISPAKTGVGIPGYLTQADVLQSIAPVITPRSDTFTVRGYGEAHDASGKVLARAMCEAVVQRTPEFVDKTDEAFTPIKDLQPVNATFGRRFNVVSFRYLSAEEMRSSAGAEG